MQYVPDYDETNELLYGFYTETAPSLSDFCTQLMDIEDGPLVHSAFATGE